MSYQVSLLSACLLEIPCQYDGRLARLRLDRADILALGDLIVPVCPEQLSGLSTPRKPVEIQGGDGFDVLSQRARVASQDGEDFTEQFIKGAEIVSVSSGGRGSGRKTGLLQRWGDLTTPPYAGERVQILALSCDKQIVLTTKHAFGDLAQPTFLMLFAERANHKAIIRRHVKNHRHRIPCYDFRRHLKRAG